MIHKVREKNETLVALDLSKTRLERLETHTLSIGQIDVSVRIHTAVMALASAINCLNGVEDNKILKSTMAEKAKS